MHSYIQFNTTTNETIKDELYLLSQLQNELTRIDDIE